MLSLSVTFGDVLEIVMADGKVVRVCVREVARGGNRVKLAIDAPREVDLRRIPKVSGTDESNPTGSGT